MAGWTKGPWVIAPDFDGTAIYGQHLIAALDEHGEPWNIAETAGGLDEGEGEPTALANARLIAAAPDLAEALEEMLAAHSMENIGVDASLRRTNAKKAARDALKKAKGEA